MNSLWKAFCVVLVTVVVAGCAAEPSADEPVPPPRWHPKPHPVDRDEKKVDAALGALDFCGLIDRGVYGRRKAPGASPVKLEAKVNDGLRGCELVRGDVALVTVRDQPTFVAAQRNDGIVVDLGGIKGYQVERRDRGEVVGCGVLVPVSFARTLRFDLEYGKRADNAQCEILREFAAVGAGKLSKDLVYPPDGQDTGRVGACADMMSNGNGDDCDPADEVPVPDGVDAILAAGARDPNVECAVFRTAIAKAFGKEFVPVATPGACYFLEPKHRLQIEVGANSLGDHPGIFGSDPTLWTDRRTVRLGGRDAVTFRNVAGNEFEIYASPYGNLDARGHVRLIISAWRERGIDEMPPPIVSAEDSVRAIGAANYVMGRYFAPG